MKLHLCVCSQRLESEKELLERDLSFKADQAKEYDSLLEAVRENNRQLQVLKLQSFLSQVTVNTGVYPQCTTANAVADPKHEGSGQESKVLRNLKSSFLLPS